MDKSKDFFSNNGLHRIYNTYGLDSLDRGVDVPDASLAIGRGEVLSPLPVIFSYTPILEMDVEPVTDVYDTFVTGEGDGLQIDSFPVGGYYGEVLGGV